MIIPMGTGCITYQQNTLERALSLFILEKKEQSLCLKCPIRENARCGSIVLLLVASVTIG